MSGKSRKYNEPQKPSLVSPIIAGLGSLIIPGLGQTLARSFRKGLLLFVSLASIVALWVWRVRIVARLETTFLGAVKKSFYLQPILLVVLIGAVLTYLWSAYDAYMTAKREPSSSGFVLWTLVLITFFFAGWQIGDIRPIEFVSGAQDAGPFMMRIL